jgi:hypothetical protein
LDGAGARDRLFGGHPAASLDCNHGEACCGEFMPARLVMEIELPSPGFSRFGSRIFLLLKGAI